MITMCVLFACMHKQFTIFYHFLHANAYMQHTIVFDYMGKNCYLCVYNFFEKCFKLKEGREK